jgi:4'-phosphopantetheinyl transferase EntD
VRSGSLDVVLHQLERINGVSMAFVRVSGSVPRAEHAAGRAAVRMAFARLGVHEAVVLGSEPDGRPRWPAGWTGSITHRDGLAIAAVARLATHLAVGVDVERDGALDVRDAELVLRAGELQWANTRPDMASAVTLLWSAKESAFKAWSTASGGLYGVDPIDIRVEVDVVAQRIQASATGELREVGRSLPLDGAFAVTAGRLITVLVHRSRTP